MGPGWLLVVMIAAALAPNDREARATPRARSSVELRVARATAKNRARFAAGDDPIPTRATWPTIAPANREALLALGVDAFESFPAGVDATWELPIDDDRALANAGVTIDEQGDAVGLLSLVTAQSKRPISQW